MKVLAVLLLYNDKDLIHAQIKHLQQNNFDILICDHSSNDGSREIIEQYRETKGIKNIVYIPRSVPFTDNGVFIYVSHILIRQYKFDYKWFVFAESDEFLEGPDRTKSFHDHLTDVDKTDSVCVNFENYAFWYTSADDESIESPRKRIKYYCYRECPQKIYAWRTSHDSIRWYNHNTVGKVHPINFKTCHYEYRKDTLVEKLKNRMEGWLKDKPKFTNYHYKHMYDKILQKGIDSFNISTNELHYDDGSDLVKDNKHDFSHIYTDQDMINGYEEYTSNHF